MSEELRNALAASQSILCSTFLGFGTKGGTCNLCGECWLTKEGERHTNACQIATNARALALIDHLESDGGVEAMRERCAKLAENMATEKHGIQEIVINDRSGPIKMHTYLPTTPQDVAAAIRALPVLGVGR